jgi:dTMP kinase
VTRGRFITLEGGEGAGKSTLLQNLSDALKKRGLKIVATREPGGTPAADGIRQLLVTGASDRWSVVSEALLFAAARNDHLERVIRPALAQGAWVLCDRYADSMWAYQVAAGGLPQETFDTLHRIIGAEQPDVTLILDLDPQTGVGRSSGAAAGEARFEGMELQFHQRVRAAFLDLAKRESSGPKEDVLAAALSAIDRRRLS